MQQINIGHQYCDVRNEIFDIFSKKSFIHEYRYIVEFFLNEVPLSGILAATCRRISDLNIYNPIDVLV